MKKLRYICLLWSVLLVFCACCRKESLIPKKVMVLHSYHKGMNYWQQELLRGLDEGFRNQRVAVKTEHFYLDFEQQQTVIHMQREIKKIFDGHSGVLQPDMIICTYDPALYALTQMKDRYVRDIPVLYCGIHAPMDDTDSITTCTGVNSFPDYKKTICLGKDLFPGIHTFRIFNCEDGMCGIRESYRPDPDPYPGMQLDSDYLQTHTVSEVLRNARKQTSYDHIPYITIIPEWNGFYSRMIRNSDFPAFLVQSIGLGQGFLGGYIAGSYNEGYHVATMAGRIFKGEDIKRIQVEETPKCYIFDWEVMQKFGIGEKQLPAGSKIIHKPFMLEYREEIWGAGLIVLFFILVAFNIYCKQLHIKRRVQKEMLANEKNLRAIMSSISEGIVSVDTRLNIFEINRQALEQMKLTGSPSDYISRPVLSLLDVVKNGVNTGFQNALLGLLEGHQSSLLVYNAVLHCLDNDYSFPVFIEISVIADDKQPVGAVIAFRDITEELNQKEYVRLIITGENLIVWRYDPKNGQVSGNRMLSPDTVKYDNYLYTYELKEAFELIHPDDLHTWKRKTLEVLRRQKTEVNMQVRIRIQGEEYCWWNSWVVTICDSVSKNIPIVLGVFMNIQSYKGLEEELVKGRVKAEQNERLKSAFLANMSHEIRNPLNAIVGFANLLCEYQDDLSADEIKSYSGLIQKNSDLLLRLIDDIVDLSCIESNTIHYQFENCDLNDLMTEVCKTLRVVVSACLELKLQIPEVTVFLCIDRQRMIQVLSNLVNNAMKFTLTGSITIGYATDPSGDVVFFVEDTGKGISPEDCEKIFNRFYKKHEEVQGAGLGLSICQMIVEHMSGTISVTSEEGVGTRFEVKIPQKDRL